MGKYVKKRKKGILILTIFLSIVAAAAIAVTIWALFFREPAVSVLAPDYAPQELEKNAEEMEDSGASKLEAPEGGGSVNLMFKDKVTIELGKNSASLYYANPAESTQDILVQIVVHDKLIAQSGRIVPGTQVKSLELKEDASKTLRPGGYDGKIILSFYNPETGEKAAVNTELPVSVTVTE